MSSTGYIGVYYHRASRKYVAQIKQHGYWHWLGYFDDPEVAARVRDVAADHLQGPDARLNFDGTAPVGISRESILAKLYPKPLKENDDVGTPQDDLRSQH